MSEEREMGYIVIALVESDGKKYRGCQVIPQTDVYADIYRQVYGPASRRDCERWAASNCENPNKPDK